jgi:hypothetical protein
LKRTAEMVFNPEGFCWNALRPYLTCRKGCRRPKGVNGGAQHASSPYSLRVSKLRVAVKHQVLKDLASVLRAAKREPPSGHSYTSSKHPYSNLPLRSQVPHQSRYRTELYLLDPGPSSQKNSPQKGFFCGFSCLQAVFLVYLRSHRPSTEAGPAVELFVVAKRPDTGKHTPKEQDAEPS